MHPRPARPARGLVLVGGAAALVAIVAAAVVVGGGGGPPASPGLRSAAPVAQISSPVVRTPVPPSTAPTVDPSAEPVIDGVACDPSEQVTHHVHAHLNVRVEGEPMIVPGDVGVRSTCLYWLHTHQPHGVIHVEAPAPRTFTLGQFFAVWGKPLDGSHVGDWTVPSGSKTWTFVNRLRRDGDPRSIELEDLTAIELQIGPAPLDPLPYTFPAELL